MLTELELSRLHALNQYQILDTLPENEYDQITKIASQICQSTVAFISFIDDKRQWFKSKIGLQLTEIPKDQAFCKYLLTHPDQEYLSVTDSRRDERFKNNPLTEGQAPFVFCVSVPLKSEDGHVVGTLCVIDAVPKEISNEQLQSLHYLAGCVMEKLEMKKQKQQQKQLIQEHELLRIAINTSSDHIFIIDPHTMRFVGVNDTAIRDLGYSREELLQMGPQDIKPCYTRKQLQDQFYDIIDSTHGFGIIETVHKKKGGALFDVQLYLTTYKEEGQTTLLIASVRDVSQQRKVQKQLIASEKKYRSLFDYLPNVVLRTDVSGTIQLISPSVSALLGYQPEELIGRTTTAIYANGEARTLLIHELNRKDAIANFRVLLRCKDGTVKTCTINAQYYYSENQSLEGIEGVITDINDLVKTQDQIGDTKEFYEKILNAIEADIAVFDERNRYCFVNKHAIKNDEVRAWLIGKTNREFCEYRNKPMEIAEKRDRSLLEAEHTGKKLEWVEELTDASGNNEYILRIVDTFGANDQRKYKVGYGFNVTSLKSTELRLAKSETYLSSLINAIPDLLLRIDASGKYLDYKSEQTEMLAMHPSNLLGKTMHDVFPKEVADFHLGFVQKALLGRETINYEYEMTTLDGKTKFFEARMTKISGAEIVAVVRDITEKKRAEAAVIKREKQLNEAQTIARLASFEWDRRTNKVEWSKGVHQLFGMQSHEAVAGLERLLEYVHPEDFQKVMKALGKLKKEYKQAALEFRIITPRGNVKYLIAKCIREKPDSKPEVIFGTVQDISEQKLFERKLLEAVMESEENERNRIAAELHDGVCQDMAAVLLTLGTANQVLKEDIDVASELIAQSKTALANALDYTRRVSHELLPKVFTERGLIHSIDALLTSLNAIDPICYSLETIGKVKEPDPVISMNLYRIIQEFIRNSQKHSNAKTVVVMFQFSDQMLNITLKDDGKGFDQENEDKNGIGFTNMSKRIEKIGGNFTLKSKPGNGVQLKLSLPL